MSLQLKQAILAALPPTTAFAPDWFWTCQGAEPELNPMPAHHQLCMRLYHAIARVHQPNSILEIGVRLGYSLGALWLGARGDTGRKVDLVGIDNESYVRSSNRLAKDNLRAIGARPLILTPRFAGYGERGEFAHRTDWRWDLIHIDGDHTYEGCRRDLGLCWNRSQMLIVDDYHPDNHPGVWRAVNEFRDSQIMRKTGSVGASELAPAYSPRKPWKGFIHFHDDDFGQPSKGCALFIFTEKENS